MEKTLAQIGYEAYHARTGGRSLFSGAPLPSWEHLAPVYKEAWEDVAKTISARAKHMEVAELASRRLTIAARVRRLF